MNTCDRTSQIDTCARMVATLYRNTATSETMYDTFNGPDSRYKSF